MAGHSDTAALAAPDVLGEEAPPEAAHGGGPARAPGRGGLQSPPLCGHSRPASGCGRLPPVQVTPVQYSRGSLDAKVTLELARHGNLVCL